MPRLTHAALVLPLLSATLAGCAGKGPAYEPTKADVAVVIYMTGTFGYSPDQVTVPANSTVEWSNRSLLTQAVTTDPAKVKHPGDVAVPAGAQAFDSGPIARSQVWRHTFTVPGIYHYTSPQYERLGMSGTIEVTP